MNKLYDSRKGDDRLHSPYRIQVTRTNGTVVVVRNEVGNVLVTSPGNPNTVLCRYFQPFLVNFAS